MLTGISKFTKMGVFSAINNLRDISMAPEYGALCGYTQQELESCFAGWIDAVSQKLDIPRSRLISKMKDYYDGFSFDGTTRVYNPFSILQLFQNASFGNYWYSSASPSFITEYMKRHGALSPETYRHVEVNELFITAQEIERAAPESFLFQSGYLTIEKREENTLTLDYPNKEVLDSLSTMYASLVYRVGDADKIGNALWRAFQRGDLEEVKRLFNISVASIPYEYFKKADEAFYKAVFLTLLRGAGIKANGEVESFRGRAGVEVFLPDRVYVIEFKTGDSADKANLRRCDGDIQIKNREYARPFEADDRKIVTATFVVDLDAREII